MALAGVNLGGWFILEKWMTPTLFDGIDAVDEFTFMQTPGAREKLRQHQKTFITEKDFAWLKNHGIKIVRIPVGYWILNGDSPYVSSIGRLDWAFTMCKKYGIQVLLDVHGLPGSQNGQDHSGHSGIRDWPKNHDDVIKGLRATVALAQRYAESPVLWGVQLINEPVPRLFNVKLRWYYNQAYKDVAAAVKPGTRIVFADAFTPRLMSGAISAANGTHPTCMDIHWYHFGGLWSHLRPKQYVHIIRWHGRLIRALKRSDDIIIGEWSGTYAQAVFDKFPVTEHDTMVQQSIQEQIAAYAAADAWFYWSYRTELPGVWNFRSLIENGLAKF